MNGHHRLTDGHMQHEFQEAAISRFLLFCIFCTIVKSFAPCSVALQPDLVLSASIDRGLSDVASMGVFHVSVRGVDCWYTGCGAG